MDESGGTRYTLEGARVYLHITGEGSDRFVHLDVDHPDLNDIIQPREPSYVGGREGGIYIGFRPHQEERAEAYLRERSPD